MRPGGWLRRSFWNLPISGGWKSSAESAFHHFHRPVIVAMAVVRVVQTPFDQVVGVISMRHSHVTAAGTVDVFGLVSRGDRLAAVGVDGIHRERVLVVMPLVWVMQMTVVQVIDVPLVLDGGVAAAGAVLVVVIFVGMVFV
jgi:hypothetical protein